MEQGKIANEINLRDVINILIRRKKIIYIFAIIGLLIGICAAFLPQKIFVYTQGYTPASYYSDNKITYLEPAVTLISRVNNSYIPQFIESYNSQNPKDTISITNNKIQFNGYKDPNLPQEKQVNYDTLYLTAEMSNKQQAAFQQLSDYVLADLVKDQAALINITRQQAQQQLAILQTSLSKYKQLDQVMQASLKRVINLAEQSDVKETDSFSLEDYMAYSMMQNKQQSLLDLQLQINNIQQQISTLKPTVAIGGIAISQKLVISKVVAILLFIVIGLIAGIILALLFK